MKQVDIYKRTLVVTHADILEKFFVEISRLYRNTTYYSHLLSLSVYLSVLLKMNIGQMNEG